MRTSAFFELMQSLAPLELAESWDNVGVLVDRGAHSEITRVCLTIDLTHAVSKEALLQQAQAIVAYHPPIFAGLKRIVASEPKGALLGELVANGMIVYSPHTALDAVSDGVNDWLLDAFDPASRKPLIANASVTGAPIAGGTNNTCAPGQGRWGELRTPIELETAVRHVKTHLGLGWVRASRGLGATSGAIRTVGVCAGAGGSVLSGCRADLLLTGEMRHHDVLDLAQKGTSVILTDHTHSERGYLPHLRSRILAQAPDLEVHISGADLEPLEIV